MLFQRRRIAWMKQRKRTFFSALWEQYAVWSLFWSAEKGPKVNSGPIYIPKTRKVHLRSPWPWHFHISPIFRRQNRLSLIADEKWFFADVYNALGVIFQGKGIVSNRLKCYFYVERLIEKNGRFANLIVVQMDVIFFIFAFKIGTRKTFFFVVKFPLITHNVNFSGNNYSKSRDLIKKKWGEINSYT